MLRNDLNQAHGAARYRRAGLPICVLIAAMVCIAQIRGSRILLTAALGMFLLCSLWAAAVRMAPPILLFFLPWSPLLKYQNGGISFFTIALLLCCLVSMIRNRFLIRQYQIFVTSILFGLTLIAKAVQGNGLSNSYLFFIAMLFLFPCVVKNDAPAFDFRDLTIFFAVGIVSAALSARQAAGYPNISQYIKIDSYLTITRLSGYYGDPNFYSAHITACLAGIQILLTDEQKRGRMAVLAVLAVLLIYCGMLSASKAFVVVFASQFLVWIPILLERRQQGSGRLRLLLGIICAVAVIVSSSAFRELFRIIDARFAYASNMSELTTGRTELWMRYLDEFMKNPLLTLLGQGYSNVNLNNRACHNTLIQGVYQFGILGFPVLWIWMLSTMRIACPELQRTQIRWKQLFLMCVGVTLPWLSLDILFFDELFLLPYYLIRGAAYAPAELPPSGQSRDGQELPIRE